MNLDQLIKRIQYLEDGKYSLPEDEILDINEALFLVCHEIKQIKETQSEIMIDLAYLLDNKLEPNWESNSQ